MGKINVPVISDCLIHMVGKKFGAIWHFIFIVCNSNKVDLYSTLAPTARNKTHRKVRFSSKATKSDREREIHTVAYNQNGSIVCYQQKPDCNHFTIRIIPNDFFFSKGNYCHMTCRFGSGLRAFSIIDCLTGPS